MEGHNNPPDMTVTAGETMRDISAWLSENPVIDNEDSARAAKLFLDRGNLCVKDLEDERDKKVRPLNEQVNEINSHYRGPRNALQAVCAHLSYRLESFLKEERRKREEIAAEARRVADEAERLAREAESREREAIGSVGHGELGVDIAAHVVQTDDAYRAADAAIHRAALAEREAKVKIGGGFSRAVSLRQKETLVVTDPLAALKILGATEDIKDAIIKSARAYRKLHDKLPDGVEAKIAEGI